MLDSHWPCNNIRHLHFLVQTDAESWNTGSAAGLRIFMLLNSFVADIYIFIPDFSLSRLIYSSTSGDCGLSWTGFPYSGPKILPYGSGKWDIICQPLPWSFCQMKLPSQMPDIHKTLFTMRCSSHRWFDLVVLLDPTARLFIMSICYLKY